MRTFHRPPSITIDNQVLEVTDHFTYLGSIISSNLSRDSEIDKRIAKAASVMARLSKRVWSNNQLTSNTKLQVYQACILRTFLYGSESWTTYARQGNHLESFHLRYLRRILRITGQDKVTNTAVLGRAGSHSIHLLCQRTLRWLSHVHRMGDDRIPKDVLYGELETDTVTQAARHCVSRMSASVILNLQTLTQAAGSRLQMTAVHGGVLFEKG